MFKLLNLAIIFVLVINPVFAQTGVFTLKNTVPNTQEYFAGAYPGAVMMKVNILGAVNKPGVYNVPVNSELTSVLSYAGGPSKEAELDEVFVRSKVGSEYKVKKINLENFFSDAKEQPYMLKPDDYVYIEQNEGLVNNNLMRTSTVIASILGIVVSILVIDKSFD